MLQFNIEQQKNVIFAANIEKSELAL